jgi:hypothetical protein
MRLAPSLFERNEATEAMLLEQLRVGLTTQVPAPRPHLSLGHLKTVDPWPKQAGLGGAPSARDDDTHPLSPPNLPSDRELAAAQLALNMLRHDHGAIALRNVVIAIRSQV